VMLDNQATQLALAEGRAKADDCQMRATAIEREIQAEKTAAEALRKAAIAARNEALALVEEAFRGSTLAEVLAEILADKDGHGQSCKFPKRE